MTTKLTSKCQPIEGDEGQAAVCRATFTVVEWVIAQADKDEEDRLREEMLTNDKASKKASDHTAFT